ncbi:tyrosine-type recombinase/integrase [Halobaculum magnesiiphilum]|uniref:Site-specific integrase n=1 Tax=Halobaculum magnesiiphilum TaxID=1017351 RepID=A0A8T8WB39_9EURY|nr:tyrosine-type recombinase/integrase [Halobaculum magnesiiphilum]QZP37050.1 site-specific integrase [Halobaculum magnesiiphilum]
MSEDRDLRRRDHLIPMSPSEGVERFLDHREQRVAKSTYQNNQTTLEQFLAWCRETGIENLNDLTGRLLADYVTHRRRRVKPISLQKELSAVRVALEYWADLDAVEPGLRERVHAPDVADGAESRDVLVDEETAEQILQYLERYHRAQREHVVLAIWWDTGMRLGALRSLDVGDLREEDHAVSLQHQPDSDTPLKNGREGERWVWLGEPLYALIEEYIEIHRDDVRDEHGRQPLITTRNGRASESTLRDISYRWTQPCRWAECPHDREPESCEAYGAPNTPSKCPSSRSPHGWRRGSITDHLNRGVSPEVVSERANVSLEVLYRHYDARQPDEKMAVRREHLQEK